MTTVTFSVCVCMCVWGVGWGEWVRGWGETHKCGWQQTKALGGVWTSTSGFEVNSPTQPNYPNPTLLKWKHAFKLCLPPLPFFTVRLLGTDVTEERSFRHQGDKPPSFCPSLPVPRATYKVLTWVFLTFLSLKIWCSSKFLYKMEVSQI